MTEEQIKRGQRLLDFAVEKGVMRRNPLDPSQYTLTDAFKQGFIVAVRRPHEADKNEDQDLINNLILAVLYTVKLAYKHEIEDLVEITKLYIETLMDEELADHM